MTIKTTWDGKKWVPIPDGYEVKVVNDENDIGMLRTELVESKNSIRNDQIARDARNTRRRNQYAMKKLFDGAERREDDQKRLDEAAAAFVYKMFEESGMLQPKAQRAVIDKITKIDSYKIVREMVDVLFQQFQKLDIQVGNYGHNVYVRINGKSFSLAHSTNDVEVDKILSVENFQELVRYISKVYGSKEVAA